MHPYNRLEEKYFWSTAVAKRNMFDISDLWDPRFEMAPASKVVTFGSCFAQHIGRALRDQGFNWLITESEPRGLSLASAKKFNYGVFSARTGNIYTVSLLKQWVAWATKETSVPEEFWEKDGRFYDPFRPNIEPDGFSSVEEMRRSRHHAIESFRSCLKRADVFVFTLGLTESWVNRKLGYEYPMCPGTVAGVFDSQEHEFINQDFQFIRKTLIDVIRRIVEINPNIKFLLTVSPVPLTATMSGNHVLVATMESKSILRAIAGSLCRKFDFVDYFPSYEIINGTPYRATFFEPNQRSVNGAGVSHVMDQFFRCLVGKFPTAVAVRSVTPTTEAETKSPENGYPSPADIDLQAQGAGQADIVCEEELLDAFSKEKPVGAAK